VSGPFFATAARVRDHDQGQNRDHQYLAASKSNMLRIQQTLRRRLHTLQMLSWARAASKRLTTTQVRELTLQRMFRPRHKGGAATAFRFLTAMDVSRNVVVI